MATSNSEHAERKEDQRSRQNALALLYQGVLTGIVRLQGGRQRLSDPVMFRRRIREALQDAQKDASMAGYSSGAIRDAESAVVAFLDEAVLSLRDPARDVWAKQTLSLELYGESNAGEIFFERLEELRGQNRFLTFKRHFGKCIYCVYCSALRGRYSGSSRSNAAVVAERLRTRIEGLRGTTGYPLSPPFRFPEPPPPTPPTRATENWKWWLVCRGSYAYFSVYFLLLQFIDARG